MRCERTFDGACIDLTALSFARRYSVGKVTEVKLSLWRFDAGRFLSRSMAVDTSYM